MNQVERIKDFILKANEASLQADGMLRAFAVKITTENEIETFYPEVNEKASSFIELNEHFINTVVNSGKYVAVGYSDPSKPGDSHKKWLASVLLESIDTAVTTEIYLYSKKLFGGWKRELFMSTPSDQHLVFVTI